MHVFVPEEHQDTAIAYVTTHYAPKITAAAMNFVTVTYESSSLTWRESEAARRRTAEINGCAICLNTRPGRDLPALFAFYGKSVEDQMARRAGEEPDETFYSSVANWRESSIFSERERLAIEYAELMGTDPANLPYNEGFWARFKTQFSDEETVDLTYCLACWIGMGRAVNSLAIGNYCVFEPQLIAAE